MNNKWNDEEIEILKNNYGIIPNKELVKILNKSLSSIQHKVSNLKIKFNNYEWTENEINILKENYLNKTYKELSSLLPNRTKTSIDLKINRLGLKKSKYHYNQDYFENIDSEDKAYWLGFIYADGCVYIGENNSAELHIKLQEKDIDHLKKFNKCIDGNIEIKKFKDVCNLNNKIYDCCSIRIYSIKMCRDLISHGAYKNKTFLLNMPNLKKELIKDFIRGYFDGDGCISMNSNKRKTIRIKFTSGCIEFLTQLREYLYLNDIKSYINKEKNQNTYNLNIGGIKNCDELWNLMYKGANIYLNRKYIKKNILYKEYKLNERIASLNSDI